MPYSFVTKPFLIITSILLFRSPEKQADSRQLAAHEGVSISSMFMFIMIDMFILIIYTLNYGKVRVRISRYARARDAPTNPAQQHSRGGARALSSQVKSSQLAGADQSPTPPVCRYGCYCCRSSATTASYLVLLRRDILYRHCRYYCRYCCLYRLYCRLPCNAPGHILPSPPLLSLLLSSLPLLLSLLPLLLPLLCYRCTTAYLVLRRDILLPVVWSLFGNIQQ